MHFSDLNDDTRAVMLAEISFDQERNKLYMSKRLNATGRIDWPHLLIQAAEYGTPESLAAELRKNGRMVAVPRNAPEVLAGSEFIRFYIRAVCVIALGRGQVEVEVYRARAVVTPSLESESKIGARLDAEALLEDLRASIGMKPALSVPPWPNSGLSVRLFPATRSALTA